MKIGVNELDLDGYIILSKLFGCTVEYIAGKSDMRNPQEVKIDDADVSFYNGIKGLNETNKMIIKNTIEALLAKQKQDESDKK